MRHQKLRRWSPINDTCPRCYVGKRPPDLWELTILDGPCSVHSVVCRNAKCDYGEILSLANRLSVVEAERIVARWRRVALTLGVAEVLTVGVATLACMLA